MNPAEERRYGALAIAKSVAEPSRRLHLTAWRRASGTTDPLKIHSHLCGVHDSSAVLSRDAQSGASGHFHGLS